MGPILLPLMIAGVGILFSIIGTFLIRVNSNDAKEPEVQRALNMGNWTSIVLTAIGSYVLINMMLPAAMDMNFFGEGVKTVTSGDVFGAVVVGLVVGALISYFTEYYDQWYCEIFKNQPLFYTQGKIPTTPTAKFAIVLGLESLCSSRNILNFVVNRSFSLNRTSQKCEGLASLLFRGILVIKFLQKHGNHT